MRAMSGTALALVSVATLWAGWRAGVPDAGTADAGTAGAVGGSGAAATPSAGGTTATGGATVTGGATPAPSAPGVQSTPSDAAPASQTVVGTAVQTRYGAVQVQVVLEGGTITDVVALHLTDRDQRSVMISERAAPVLRQEVLAAQSASVDTVSGATYTSQGYLTSLQSALDAARA